VVLVAGWVLGSAPLGLAGTGLALGGAAAFAVSAFARRITIERTVESAILTEGEAIASTVTVHGVLLVPATIRFTEQAGQARSEPVRLRRRHPVRVTVPSLPRGVYDVGPGALAVTDLLGLVETAVKGPPGVGIVVRPRVVELAGSFAAGRGTGIGARGVATRTGGSEPHGIREYREGESLRAVHWVSSARRGRLMVRELEEPPDDDTVVVLDLAEAGHAGPPGRTSTDEAVRAAAALVRWEVTLGRSVGLVIGGPSPLRHRIGSLANDWEAALDALAAARPTRTPLVIGASAGSTILVTTGTVGTAADALLRRRLAASRSTRRRTPVPRLPRPIRECCASRPAGCRLPWCGQATT
jgi:uncharacterized protein (DUF58 family)